MDNSISLGQWAGFSRDEHAEDVGFQQDNHIDHLNAKVAVLLNKERGKFPLLSASQCHAIINTFERMQDARDEEIYCLVKPLIDHLKTTISRIDAWKTLAGLPRSDLLKALSTLVTTDRGIKPRSFELEELVLVAIETSNKIFRALAIENKYVGLSKNLALLKHDIKTMMANVQDVLADIMRSTQKIPSTGAVHFGARKVGLKKGLPSYLDPDDKKFKIASSKHPLVKAPGSDWTKWLRRHNTKFIRIDPRDDAFWMKIYVPEGPILELREAFRTAREVERAIGTERLLVAQGQVLSNIQSQEINNHDMDIATPSERDVDIEYLEDAEWDFATYLNILDHKKVDYAQAGNNFSSEEPDILFYDQPWTVSGRELSGFLYPNYVGPVNHRVERIFHPADLQLFGNMAYDSNLPSVAAANGALNSTILDDELPIGEIRNHARDNNADVPFIDRSIEWEDKDWSGNSFVRDGLYLDQRSSMMRVNTLMFWPPNYQSRELVSW